MFHTQPQPRSHTILLDGDPPHAVLGRPYTAAIPTTKSSTQRIFSALTDDLPPGLQFHPNATLSGTPTKTGTFTFYVAATDTDTETSEWNWYSVTVCSTEAEAQATNCFLCPPKKPLPKIAWYLCAAPITLIVVLIIFLKRKGTKMKRLLASLVVVAFIAFPYRLAATKPELLTPLALLLFDLLLFAASSWLAISISAQDAKRKAADT
jgi:hypothetical protein